MSTMRILFVTPYPPPFDERSSAAIEHVRALRAEGHGVEVMSPTPSAAHHHLEPGSWRSLVPMMRRFRRVDRVEVADELLGARPLGVALRVARSVATWRAPAPLRPVTQPTPEPDAAWPSDRDAAMVEIRAQAARRRAPAPTGGLGAGMRRVPPLVLPDPASGRSVAAGAKRVVRRLTAWQLDPIVTRVNQMRSAVIDELETQERHDDG